MKDQTFDEWCYQKITESDKKGPDGWFFPIDILGHSSPAFRRALVRLVKTGKLECDRSTGRWGFRYRQVLA